MATDEGYMKAIELLRKRFGNKSQTEQVHPNTLRTAHHVRSSEDVVGLRKLYECVHTNIRGLTSLGVLSTSYLSMMCDILSKAMPSDLVVAYHRHRS